VKAVYCSSTNSISLVRTTGLEKSSQTSHRDRVVLVCHRDRVVLAGCAGLRAFFSDKDAPDQSGAFGVQYKVVHAESTLTSPPKKSALVQAADFKEKLGKTCFNRTSYIR
jgi:hypothetical protein